MPIDSIRARRRRSPLILGLCLLLAVSACTSPGNPMIGSAQQRAGQLTANQLKYGASPGQDSTLTYQSDVVLVGGGADSVKSVSADGMVWTIRSAAAHAAELQPGKIMVASGLGAGRILAVRNVGADTQVLIGPAGLTDIVHDGEFSSTTPVSLDHVQAYSTPTRPGLVSPLDPTAASTNTAPLKDAPATAQQAQPGSSAPPGSVPAGPPGAPTTGQIAPPSGLRRHATAGSFSAAIFPADPLRGRTGQPVSPPGLPDPPALPDLGTLPVPSPTAPTEAVGAYTLTPFCCSGLGVHLKYTNGGTKVYGTLTLHLDRPSVTFDVKIVGGKLVNAAVELHGAGGIGLDFSAATEVGVSGNVERQRVQVPVAFTVPLLGLPLPISIRVEQTFSLSTAFSEKGTISGSAEYSFGGTIGFGIHNGVPAVYNPAGFTVKKSLVDSLQSVSAGPTAMILGYQAKFSVGVGLLGFAASAWVALDAAFAVGTGSSLALVACRTAGLTLSLAYGVGYQIPVPVAALVNVFLRLFQARPIKASGGLAAGPMQVLHKQDTEPAGNACA